LPAKFVKSPKCMAKVTNVERKLISPRAERAMPV
jgi:hypothetical protein